MPLHNTEELKAAPTSPLESEVLNEETGTYEFPEGSRTRKASTRPSTISWFSTATRSRTWRRFARHGSSRK